MLKWLDDKLIDYDLHLSLYFRLNIKSKIRFWFFSVLCRYMVRP
jgi:hypothetical protein